MDNKANVKIYGREYTVTGEKPEDAIRKIAEYVDSKMKLISRVAGDPPGGSIAVLSAINIAEEYFDALEQIETLKASKARTENDLKYYLKMWEDTKKSFRQNKDEMANMKSREYESEARFKELQAKCSEYENSFFDLQMENIRLKSELDKMKKGENGFRREQKST